MTWLGLLRPWLGGRVVFTRRTAFPVPARKERRSAWKWLHTDALIANSQAAAFEPRRPGFSICVIPSATEAQALDQAHLHVFAQYFDPLGRRALATAAELPTQQEPGTLVRAVHIL